MSHNIKLDMPDIPVIEGEEDTIHTLTAAHNTLYYQMGEGSGSNIPVAIAVTIENINPERTHANQRIDR